MRRPKKLAAGLVLSALASGGAVFAACASPYDEAIAPDADTTSEAGDSPATGDGADAASKCVPASVQVIDAGVDASCDGTGLMVDLSASVKHCGRCGHDCLDHGCVGGKCVVKAITTGEVGPPKVSSSAGGFLYYAASVPQGSLSQVRRLSIDTGAASTIASPAPTGIGETYSAQVVGQRVYFIYTPEGAFEVSAAGGVATKLVDAPNAVTYLVADTTNVYWSLYTGTVTGRPHTAGANAAEDFTIHFDPSLPEVTALAADGTRIYWAARSLAAADGGAQTSVVKMRGPGKTDSVFARASGLPYGISALALDAEYIYWATDGAEVWRMPKIGGSSPSLVTRLVGGLPNAKGLAVDDTSVYVAASRSSETLLELVQASKCGGPPRLLAADEIWGVGLVSVGPYLYWGRNSGVMRIPK